MNEISRQKLIELVSAYGPAVIEDPRRCQALLQDYSGIYKREVKLFSIALQENIPQDIFIQVASLQSKLENQQSTKNVLPQELFLAQFKQRLIENCSINTEAAQWTVEAWALALQFITLQELSENSASITATPATIATGLQPNLACVGQPTLTVAQSGQGQYKSIGAAIQAANPGTRILVKPGVYPEALVLDKPLEIVGAGKPDEIVIEEIKCLQPSIGRTRIQNVTLRGSLVLEKGQLELFVCEVLHEIKVTGESSQLIARKSKINTLVAAEATLNFEECALQSANVFGMSAATFIKSSLASLTIGNSHVSPQPKSNIDPARLKTRLDHCQVGSVNIATGNPHFSNCTFIPAPTTMYSQPRYFPTVKISSTGSGLFENCDFSGQPQTPTIFILGHGTPVFRQCKVHNSIVHGATGIYFGEDTEGLVDECEIYSNGCGIELARGSNPIVSASKISQNAEYGIFVHQHGSGVIENCDLPNNKKGAFKLEPNCFTRRINNKD